MQGGVPGIHHITAVTGDGQANLDFYTRFLGLRLVKRTVNFDAPGSYHLYYGDRTGRPGTALTFFVWPRLRRGVAGAGLVTRVAFRIPEGSADFWASRLDRGGIPHDGPAGGPGGLTLTFADPDGLPLALVTAGEGRGRSGVEPWAGGPVAEEHALLGFHGATLTVPDAGPTHDVLTRVLGLIEAEEADGGTGGESATSGRLYRPGTEGAGGPGRALLLVVDSSAPPGRVGRGSVHHLAWRVADEEAQQRVRGRAMEAGLQPTPPVDRHYFRSVYFREPGGVLFELATEGPGFTADEAAGELGSSLRLPPWLEERREEIEERLPELTFPESG